MVVLVIDDCSADLFLASRGLSSRGHRVFTAGSYDDGFVILSENESIEVVLLDVNMPDSFTTDVPSLFNEQMKNRVKVGVLSSADVEVDGISVDATFNKDEKGKLYRWLEGLDRLKVPVGSIAPSVSVNISGNQPSTQIGNGNSQSVANDGNFQNNHGDGRQLNGDISGDASVGLGSGVSGEYENKGKAMAKENSGGVQFNAPIAGDAKVNAADGKWVEGDEVHGDKASHGGNIVKDNATVDSINQSFSFEQGVTKGLFDAIRAELNADESAAFAPDDSGAGMTFSDELIAESNQYAADLVDSSPEQQSRVDNMTPLTMFNSYEEELSKPEDEQDVGYLSAMVRRTKQYSPVFVRAALSGGEAYLRSTIKTSPWVAAALAAVAVVKGGR